MSDTEVLSRLFATIEARKGANPDSSYTAKLLHKGAKKCAQKVGEEAVEVAIAATSETADDVAAESADLLYHLAVLWAATGVTPDQVFAKLAQREGTSGLDEKAARPE